jgi:hypothetical protein
MGYAIQVVFGFEYTVFIGDSSHKQHLHLEVFTQKELIWTIDFIFGVHKLETTYIPSNRMWDFIVGKEHVVMLIASSHAGNYEEMKEGNCFIHIGIIIWNVLGFE